MEWCISTRVKLLSAFATPNKDFAPENQTDSSSRGHIFPRAGANWAATQEAQMSESVQHLCSACRGRQEAAASEGGEVGDLVRCRALKADDSHDASQRSPTRVVTCRNMQFKRAGIAQHWLDQQNQLWRGGCRVPIRVKCCCRSFGICCFAHPCQHWKSKFCC